MTENVMRSILKQCIRTSAAALLVLLLGCSDTPTSPGIEPEIVNAVDSFEYQVSDIQNYSGMASYTWQNTGTAANVDLSSVVTSGSGTLFLVDPQGRVLFERPLATDGSFATEAGNSGEWSIRVLFDSFSGTINFRAQKTT
jgi:hypothetical protein